MKKLLTPSRRRGLRGFSRYLTNELSLLAKSGFAHDPYLEWTVATSDYSGDPYDVEATATFTPRGGGTAITMPLFYAGGNSFSFRFTAPKVDTYDVTVSSTTPSLDGLTTRTDIAANPNQDAHGYLTGVSNPDGTGSFAYLYGDAGTPRRTLYNGWMRDDSMTNPDGISWLADLSSTASTRGTQIEAILDGMEAHGLNTYQIVVGHSWVEWGLKSNQASTNVVPDDVSFTVLEDLLTRAAARGLNMHLWAWGDSSNGSSTDELTSGTNGYVDLRIQRYIQGRLGCFPSWSMGYAWDLEEFITETELRAWYANMTSLSTTPRLLAGRESQERAPDPVFELGTDRTNLFSWDGYPTDAPGHTYYDDALDPQETNPKPSGRPTGLPMLYSARFFLDRLTPGGHQYTESELLRLLWQQAMANGTASIIGTHGSGTLADFTYPERFKTLTQFFDPRFHQALEVVTTIDGVAVDGIALATSDGALQMLYKENTSSIQVRIPTGMTNVNVVVQDVLAAHAEASLGTYDAGTHTIALPSTSTWAIAVGDFGVEVAELSTNALYVSTTGNDSTGDGTIESPYRSLTKIASVVQPGDTVYLRGGTYDTVGTDVYLSGYPGDSLQFSGTQAAPITIGSYPGEWAILDGRNHPNHPRTETDGLSVEDPNLLRFIGEWVIWQDLEFKNGVGKLFHVTGNRNIIRRSKGHHAHSDALYIQGSYNHIEDWVGHDLWSVSIGGNAGDSIKFHDGSQIETYYPGSGTHDNTVLRAGAYNCCDDGFDVITCADNTFTECWSFNIGFGSTGNGEGFKLGGSSRYQFQGNKADRCISAWNRGEGFDTNGGVGIDMFNNTAWHNGEYGFRAQSDNAELDADGETGITVVRNGIAYEDATGTNAPVLERHYISWENNAWQVGVTDPGWISTDPANADFMALSTGSAARGVGVGGADLGALQYGEQFSATYWPIVMVPNQQGGVAPTIPDPA